MDNKQEQKITFHVFLRDGSPNPDIRRSFLQRQHVTAQDAIAGELILEDKSKWKLILEDAVHRALKASDACFCIVSYQLRKQGAYAVARMFDEKRVRTQKENIT